MMLTLDKARTLFKGSDTVFCITAEKDGRWDFVAIEVDGDSKVVNSNREDALRRMKSLASVLPEYKLKVCGFSLGGFIEACEVLKEHECEIGINARRRISSGMIAVVGKGGKVHESDKL